MAHTSTTRATIFTSIILVLFCGPATAVDIRNGSRPAAFSDPQPINDLPSASKIKRCKAVISNPAAFDSDLYELCKLLQRLKTPQRPQQPSVELSQSGDF